MRALQVFVPNYREGPPGTDGIINAPMASDRNGRPRAIVFTRAVWALL